MNRRYYLIILLFILAGNTIFSQIPVLEREYKLQTVNRINELLNDHYVFPDVAKSSGAHLVKRFEQGYYDTIQNIEIFSKALTDDLQSVNHDKHIRVRRLVPDQRWPADTAGDGGFTSIKMLEGNIGYISLRLFFPASRTAAIADSCMKRLASADAIIIDLRNNTGGSPDMVQYLCSYFFERKIHLNSIYRRATDKTTEFWTVDVPGQKMPATPLFILTSKKTFSAAEEFSYNMQTQKRAVLIGATTAGGANPGGLFPVNNELSIFIPTGRAINPITGTNWEGKGVVPDIQVEEALALETATSLALKASAEHKIKKTNR